MTISTPVTLDDVRATLGDTDPRTTNAGALRSKLGKGSVSTIQKHLDKLRADLMPAVVTPGSPTPAAPAEALGAIWSAAWSAAQAQTLGRLNIVSQERDAARERITLLIGDLEAVANQLDQTTEAQAQSAQRTSELTAQAERCGADLTAARVEIERLNTASEHAAQLALRDGELKDKAHQQDREYLLNQIAELKSALHRTPPSS
jgi:hypothetical protein